MDSPVALPEALIAAGYKLLVYSAGFLYASVEDRKSLRISPVETYCAFSPVYGCTIRSENLHDVAAMAYHQIRMKRGASEHRQADHR